MEPYGPLWSFELQDKETNKILEKCKLFLSMRNHLYLAHSKEDNNNKQHTGASKRATAKTKMQEEWRQGEESL